MQKTFNIITPIVLALSVMLGIASPVSGQACECSGVRIVPPIGQSKAVTDAAYVNITGDTMTGALNLPNASVDTHAMNRITCDGRFPQLVAATNTFTGVHLGPDGTSTDPTYAFSANPKTGFYLAKVSPNRIGLTFNGVLVTTFDAIKGIDTAGNVVFGAAIGNTAICNGGTWTWPNDTSFIFGGDIHFNSAAFQMLFTSGNLEVQGAKGWAYNPGGNVDTDIFRAEVAGNPKCFWDESEDKFSFTKNIIVPDGPPIVVMFGGGTDPHADTNSATYTTVGIFHFEGTTARGIPSSVKFIGFKDASPTSWEMRLFDLTNSLEIAEVTGTATVTEILTDSTLTNLPAGEAILELQLKKTSGTGSSEAHAYSAAMLF